MENAFLFAFAAFYCDEFVFGFMIPKQKVNKRLMVCIWFRFLRFYYRLELHEIWTRNFREIPLNVFVLCPFVLYNICIGFQIDNTKISVKESTHFIQLQKVKTMRKGKYNIINCQPISFTHKNNLTIIPISIIVSVEKKNWLHRASSAQI